MLQLRLVPCYVRRSFFLRRMRTELSVLMLFPRFGWCAMLSRDRGAHRAQDPGRLVNSWAGDLSSGARGLARRSRFDILSSAALRVSLLSGMCTSWCLASSTPATSRWCPAQQTNIGRYGVHRRTREFPTPKKSIMLSVRRIGRAPTLRSAGRVGDCFAREGPRHRRSIPKFGFR